LENIRVLRFHSTKLLEPMVPRFTPSQLTRVDLDRCYFDTNISNQVQHLPALIFLKIQESRIDGALHQYFMLPELRELHLHNIIFAEIEDGTKSIIMRHFSDDISSCIPKVTTMYLTSLELGKGLTNFLRGCPLLQHLVIEDCITDKFIGPFSECITSRDPSFTNLKKLRVQNSWPAYLRMTWEVFMQRCASARPDVHLSCGNFRRGMRTRGPCLYRRKLSEDSEYGERNEFHDQYSGLSDDSNHPDIGEYYSLY
jgi:hypothetical protein